MFSCLARASDDLEQLQSHRGVRRDHNCDVMSCRAAGVGVPGAPPHDGAAGGHCSAGHHQPKSRPQRSSCRSTSRAGTLLLCTSLRSTLQDSFLSGRMPVQASYAEASAQLTNASMCARVAASPHLLQTVMPSLTRRLAPSPRCCCRSCAWPARSAAVTCATSRPASMPACCASRPPPMRKERPAAVL